MPRFGENEIRKRKGKKKKLRDRLSGLGQWDPAKRCPSSAPCLERTPSSKWKTDVLLGGVLPSRSRTFSDAPFPLSGKHGGTGKQVVYFVSVLVATPHFAFVRNFAPFQNQYCVKPDVRACRDSRTNRRSLWAFPFKSFGLFDTV